MVLAGALALGLAACETPVETQKLPEITFGHEAPIRLNVARIEVVSDYQPPMKAPNVDHLFPTPPLKALRTWARQRLKAVGRSGTARFVIRDAKATESALEMKKGFTATFTKQQSQRFDLAVDAELRITEGPSHGFAEARAMRFSTIREDASLNAREKLWFDLTEKLMADFDKEMENNIRHNLGHWLR